MVTEGALLIGAVFLRRQGQLCISGLRTCQIGASGTSQLRGDGQALFLLSVLFHILKQIQIIIVAFDAFPLFVAQTACSP